MVEAITIEARRSDWPDPSTAVDLLQAVADPVRWTVLARLATGTACVCELPEHFPIAANLLSYHLKVLREAGLVTTALVAAGWLLVGTRRHGPDSRGIAGRGLT